jgi:predicted GH43/DUF377 family glycosyl hydrolase
MKWIKKGKIFIPTKVGDVEVSHAQCPIPILLGNTLRIYYSWRPPATPDGQFTSFGGFIEVDKNDPSRVIYVHNKPILELGAAGDFDHFGIMPGTVIEENGRIFLYYCGWDRKVSTPYNWAIGLAVSDDHGLSFRRVGKGPILGPTNTEPFLQACPVVQIIRGTWHMWYLSGTEWHENGPNMDSIYTLMHATSKDGLNWQRNGCPFMPQRVDHECQTSAALLEIDGQLHMWFSYRYGTNFRNAARGYRIGHAVSSDMIKWTRDDANAGISLSAEGWDSEMQCYPSIVSIDDHAYMFYCGNQFGIDGFGFAVLDKSKSSADA